jgi:uncharacterized membrane protein YphA (DoxX/SURF4 family)
MPDKLTPKAQAFLLILRWTIAIIFFANGVPKLWDPGFGAHADSFFASLRDDVIFGPYKTVFKDLIIPNAFIIASFVKYAEITIGVIFFIGWPLRLGALLATFLHLNYLCIASFPTFIYLNVLMIVCEWMIRSAHEKQ